MVYKYICIRVVAIYTLIIVRFFAYHLKNNTPFRCKFSQIFACIQRIFRLLNLIVESISVVTTHHIQMVESKLHFYVATNVLYLCLQHLYNEFQISMAMFYRPRSDIFIIIEYNNYVVNLLFIKFISWQTNDDKNQGCVCVCSV